MLGSTPLLISLLLKCTPARWVEKFKVGIVDETKEVKESGLLKAFNQASSMQVGTGKKEPKDDNYQEAAAAEAPAGKKKWSSWCR